MVAAGIQGDGEPRGRGEVGGRPVVAGGAEKLERGAEDCVQVVGGLLQQLDPLAAEQRVRLEKPEQPDEGEERVAGVVREAGRERPERCVARKRDECALDGRPLLPLGKRLYR
jgi:hypothetical protein